MQVTRRYWLTVGVTGILLLWSIILEQQILLVSAATLCAWLLTRQYQFVQNTSAAVESLEIEYHLGQVRVTAEETTVCTLTARVGRVYKESIQVEAEPPVGSYATTATCMLDTGTQAAQTTFDLTWPVAGSFTFNKSKVIITSSLGLFQQTTDAGPTPSVTVEPRAPRDIHIGEAGNRIAVGFGRHDAGQIGSGLTPAEVRQYTPSDTAAEIDWKATARLNDTYIREFEAGTDLETVLIIDHRESMGVGQAGETKLDFACQVALALVNSAREYNDPIGWYSVGNRGLTDTFAPSTNSEQYRIIASQIMSLKPTASLGQGHSLATVDPAIAKRIATQLSDESQFSTTLRPFFDSVDTYVQRVAEKPLFSAVRTASARRTGNNIFILTDDNHRTELQEAIKLARQNNRRVTVFLMPTVLYNPQTMRDVDDAYRQYTEFEQFRQELAAVPRVTAFEVGPSDRLADVLSAGRKKQETT